MWLTNLLLELFDVDIENCLGFDVHDIAVLLAIAKFNGYRHVTPSYDRIASIAKISKRKVIYCVNNLIKRGFIKKSHRFMEGENMSNEYVVDLAKMVAELEEVGKEMRASLVKLRSIIDGTKEKLSTGGSAHGAPPSAQHARGVVHSVHPNKKIDIEDNKKELLYRISDKQTYPQYNNYSGGSPVTPRQYPDSHQVMANLQRNGHASKPSALLEEYMNKQAAKYEEARKTTKDIESGGGEPH